METKPPHSPASFTHCAQCGAISPNYDAVTGQCLVCYAISVALDPRVADTPRGRAHLAGEEYYKPSTLCKMCGKRALRRTYDNFCCRCMDPAKHAAGGERARAREVGMATYITGRKCKRGHESPRYVSNGQCVDCARVDGPSRPVGSARRAAMHYNLRFYKTDSPCPRGHWAQRLTRTGQCAECLRTHPNLQPDLDQDEREAIAHLEASPARVHCLRLPALPHKVPELDPRDAAGLAGSATYNPGRQCKRGHDTPWSTATGTCTRCEDLGL